jgi:hypothetical protein
MPVHIGGITADRTREFLAAAGGPFAFDLEGEKGDREVEPSSPPSAPSRST